LALYSRHRYIIAECVFAPKPWLRFRKTLRAELTNAAVTLDAGQIAAVIERISKVDAALGSALAYYADRFSLTMVWEALKDSKSITSET
jgi:hypothetical protein